MSPSDPRVPLRCRGDSPSPPPAVRVLVRTAARVPADVDEEPRRQRRGPPPPPRTMPMRGHWLFAPSPAKDWLRGGVSTKCSLSARGTRSRPQGTQRGCGIFRPHPPHPHTHSTTLTWRTTPPTRPRRTPCTATDRRPPLPGGTDAAPARASVSSRRHFSPGESPRSASSFFFGSRSEITPENGWIKLSPPENTPRRCFQFVIDSSLAPQPVVWFRIPFGSSSGSGPRPRCLGNPFPPTRTAERPDRILMAH